METKYDNSQIEKATEMLLAGKRISEISKQTGISLTKLSIMRKRIKDSAVIKSIDDENRSAIALISNMTNGLSNEVRRLWVNKISDNWKELSTTATAPDIRRKLDSFAAEIKQMVASKRGVSKGAVDIALSYIVDSQRKNHKTSLQKS